MFMRCCLFFLLSSCVHLCLAQEKVTTVGFQLRPIFRGEFFNTTTADVTNETSGVRYIIAPQPGFTVGMVIRKGIIGNISLEIGINYVKRIQKLTITDLSFTGESIFRIVGAELPLLALIYIRLGKHLFVNNAAGISLDLFPSNIKTYDTYFFHASNRVNWVLPALLANVGFEWRTGHYGYFYLGASYHRPLAAIMKSRIEYTGANKRDIFETDLSGNYFTIDLRYFFYQPPAVK